MQTVCHYVDKRFRSVREVRRSAWRRSRQNDAGAYHPLGVFIVKTQSMTMPGRRLNVCVGGSYRKAWRDTA